MNSMFYATQCAYFICMLNKILVQKVRRSSFFISILLYQLSKEVFFLLKSVCMDISIFINVCCLSYAINLVAKFLGILFCSHILLYFFKSQDITQLNAINLIRWLFLGWTYFHKLQIRLNCVCVCVYTLQRCTQQMLRFRSFYYHRWQCKWANA